MEGGRKEPRRVKGGERTTSRDKVEESLRNLFNSIKSCPTKNELRLHVCEVSVFFSCLNSKSLNPNLIADFNNPDLCRYISNCISYIDKQSGGQVETTPQAA